MPVTPEPDGHTPPEPSAPAPARLFRGFLEDFLAEGVLALVSLAVFAGVTAATVWGWGRSRWGTIGVYVLVGAFLGYGVRVLWKSRHRNGGPVSRTKIATIASCAAVAVGIWLAYVVSYGPL